MAAPAAVAPVPAVQVANVHKVSFPSRGGAAFAEEVKAEVAAWFKRTGRSEKATPGMVLKTVLLVGTWFGAYFLILFGGLTPLAMLGLAVVMGITMAGIGFAVAHDALHGAYSSRPWVNRLIGSSFELVGANGYLWKITHNVIHHTYSNINGVDEDLAVSPLLRLSPHAERKWFHRWQHLYAWVAYGFTTVFWVFAKDYQQILKKDLGPYQNKRHPRGEVAWLLGSKLLYYTYMIVIPLLVLPIPAWQFALGFLVMHMVAGTILGVVFQLAHVVEQTDHPLPDEDGAMEHTWAVHEMHTTANFARGNLPLTWYVGGLNHQVEHHLFPRVCSVHYPAISEIVKRVADKHGVPYHEHRTFRRAVKSHYLALKALGRGEPVPMHVAA